MERAVTVRPALPEDGQVLFAMNRAFNGEGVASPQEAALALAHPGSERVLLAFVAGEPAGFLCGLLKRSACYSRPSAEGDGAVRLPRLPPPGRGPAAAGSFPGRLPPRGRGGRHGAHREGQRPPPRPYIKVWVSPPAGRSTSSRGCEYGSKKSPGFSGGFPVYQAFALQSARRFS